MSINLMQAHGQLYYEPTLDSLSSSPFTKNTIMVRRSYRNPKTKDYDYDYIPFIARGNIANFIAENLHRLDYVYIVGRLITNDNKSYVDVNEIDIDRKKVN